MNTKTEDENGFSKGEKIRIVISCTALLLAGWALYRTFNLPYSAII